MLISKGNLNAGCLDGQIAIVTGAGQGIGLEAARSLAWLGARVVIAEINSTSGHAASDDINEMLGPGRAIFIHTDVGNEDSVRHLKRTVTESMGKVSVVINNATITPIGSAADVPIEKWDASYRVNLRGPALMAIEFLPDMIARNSGVFICVASLGVAYLTAYETFKEAQVRMATTLNLELEEKNVYCFTVNPGLVRTPRALECIKALAPIHGKTMEEFIESSGEQLLSMEAAGAGFAAAVALAEQFRGQEITSRQALLAAGIRLADPRSNNKQQFLPEPVRKEAEEICGSVIVKLTEQAVKWTDKSLLERQWIFQDFKHMSGMSVENWIKTLQQLEGNLEHNTPWKEPIPLDKLANYFENVQKSAPMHVNDSSKLEEQVMIFKFCQKEVEQLEELIKQ